MIHSWHKSILHIMLLKCHVKFKFNKITAFYCKKKRSRTIGITTGDRKLPKMLMTEIAIHDLLLESFKNYTTETLYIYIYV